MFADVIACGRVLPPDALSIMAYIVDHLVFDEGVEAGRRTSKVTSKLVRWNTSEAVHQLGPGSESSAVFDSTFSPAFAVRGPRIEPRTHGLKTLAILSLGDAVPEQPAAL